MGEILLSKARRYTEQRQLELAKELGSGKDGIVRRAKHKTEPGEVAIKVLRDESAYWREKKAYERLRARGVTRIRGFNVPQLIDSDDDLLVLEMTIVKQPFVVDFAGARLDVRLEFSEDVWATWEADKKEQFEERWGEVREILAAFERLGIYLLDVSPSNIAFLENAGR